MALLTINSGSSSLKFGLYTDDGTSILAEGKVEEIGHPIASLTLNDPTGKELARQTKDLDTQEQALSAASKLLAQHTHELIQAIGHRIVHGGPHLREHCALTDEVLKTLEASIHFAPLHIPPAIKLVRATEKEFPQACQFACFDTQFHTTLPPEAFTYALPRPYRDAGVRRYGFHGLSYESIVRQLGDKLKPRTVVAHLGGGSSLCALAGGSSIDTSMGMSPCGGVPMATRSGDLDPGVALLLERDLTPALKALTPDELEKLLNKQSGMQALAEESDMRKLTERASAGDLDAELALNIFTRDIAKTIAAYASVLGGLDLVVFTGGIGEHSQSIRDRIAARLTWLPLEFLVQPTDEDGQIALHVATLMHQPA